MAITLTKEQLEQFWNADALISQQDPALYTHIVGDKRYIENFDAYVKAAGLEGESITALRAEIVAKHEAAVATLNEMEYGYSQMQLFGSSNNFYELVAKGDFKTLGYTETAAKTIFTGLEAPTPLTVAELQPVPAVDVHAEIQAEKDRVAAAVPTTEAVDPLKAKVYQGLVMILDGSSLKDTPVPDFTNAEFDDINAGYAADLEKDVSYADNNTLSRTTAIEIARKAATGATLNADESHIFHTLLVLNGHAEDKNFAFDETITAAERTMAAAIVKGYKAGRSTADNAADAAAARVKAAEIEAARLEAERLAAEEAAKLAAEAAAAADATEQTSLRQTYGLAALGYSGSASENLYAFANDFEHALIRQGYGKDFAGVMEGLSDPAKLEKAVSHVIANGDYRAIFLARLETGNAEAIKSVQAGLGIRITGQFNDATDAAMGEYIKQKIGLMDDNELSIHSRKTFSSEYVDFLRKNGLEESDDAFAKFREENPDAFRYGLSQSSIARGLQDGSIPILMDKLPPELQARLAKMEGDQFERQRAMLIARHLTEDHAHFRAYDKALKERDTSDLTARLDKLEVTTTLTAGDVRATEADRIVAAAERAEAKGVDPARAAIDGKDLPATASVAETFAADRLLAAHLHPHGTAAWKSMPAAGNLYMSLPSDTEALLAIRNNDDAPGQVRGLASLKLQIEQGVMSLEDGSALGATASIKGDIAAGIGRFMTRFEKLSPDAHEYIERNIKGTTTTPDVAPKDEVDPTKAGPALVGAFGSPAGLDTGAAEPAPGTVKVATAVPPAFRPGGLTGG